MNNPAIPAPPTLDEQVVQAIEAAYEVLPYQPFREWALFWMLGLDRSEAGVQSAREKFAKSNPLDLLDFSSDQLFAGTKAMISASALAWFKSKPSPNLSSTRIITESASEAVQFAEQHGRADTEAVWNLFWKSVGKNKVQK